MATLANVTDVFLVQESNFTTFGTSKELHFLEKYAISNQVWSLTQFYSVDFSKSRIDVQKCVFNKHTIKVCASCG